VSEAGAGRRETIVSDERREPDLRRRPVYLVIALIAIEEG
jgi:hypothetical protein